MTPIWVFLAAVFSLHIHTANGQAVHTTPATDDGLIQRLVALEKRGLEQDSLIAKLVNKVEKQDVTILEQQGELEKLKTEISKLNYDINRKSELEEQNHAVETTRKQRRLASGRTPQQRFVMYDPERPLAFHARIDHGSIDHIAITDKLVFDITVLDMGGAYDNTTGVFTAPADGLYFFSISVTIIHDQKSIHAEIMKNGIGFAGSYAFGNGQGSISVVVSLVTGDKVWVSSIRHNDTYLWGDTLTSFIGFLIVPTY